MNITYKQTILHQIVSVEAEIGFSKFDQKGEVTIRCQADTKAEAVQKALKLATELETTAKEIREKLAAL